MPRKRMISPNFWRDEKIAECSLLERLLFQGLWTFAEDNGVGRANPKLIKADIFPYDTLRDSDIEKGLVHLASLGLIQIYIVDQQRYYHVTNFKKHQTINRPSPSSLPLPDHSVSAHVLLIDEDNTESNLNESSNTDSTNPITSSPVVCLPLNDGTEYPVSQEQVEKYQELYPAVDVMQELRGMYGWLDANPIKRKTKAGILRFINSWLAKRQNQGGSTGTGGNVYGTAKPARQFDFSSAREGIRVPEVQG